jgi:hypothetical protein
MILSDFNLLQTLGALSAWEQKAIEAHLAGNPTPQSWAAIRRLRRSLKKKTRGTRPPNTKKPKTKKGRS